MCNGSQHLGWRIRGQGVPPMGTADLERTGVTTNGVVNEKLVNATMGVGTVRLRGIGRMIGPALGINER